MDRYEAFLFDWDGTLARTVEIWLKVVQACLARRGIAVSEQQIAALYGDYQMPVRLGLPTDMNDEFHAEMAISAAAPLANAELYAGAREVLQALKSRDKKLALISNSRRENIGQVLDRWNLAELFDTIVAQEDAQEHKPDPEALLLALDRLRAPAARALVLGDTRNDIEAARAANIDSLLFYPPSHQALYDFKELAAHRPTLTIHAWDDLLERV